MKKDVHMDLLNKKINLLFKFRKCSVKEEIEKKDFKDYVVAKKGNDAKHLVRVVYRTPLSSGKVGVALVRKMVKNLQDGEYQQSVLIGKSFSHSAKVEAAEANIEVISEQTIPSFDIFDHELVPHHEILGEEECKELLDKYSVAPHMLPRIKKLDAVVILIGAKQGDIVKITRESPTAGIHVTYRYVV